MLCTKVTVTKRPDGWRKLSAHALAQRAHKARAHWLPVRTEYTDLEVWDTAPGALADMARYTNRAPPAGWVDGSLDKYAACVRSVHTSINDPRVDFEFGNEPCASESRIRLSV